MIYKLYKDLLSYNHLWAKLIRKMDSLHNPRQTRSKQIKAKLQSRGTLWLTYIELGIHLSQSF